ncbi:MAG TPA: trypsin-like peptidase domain-containing protein [Candidatus Dormibacteraeota bacterium]
MTPPEEPNQETGPEGAGQPDQAPLMPAPPPMPPVSYYSPPIWEPPPTPRKSRLVVVAVAAVLVVGLALGGGIGIGWTLARILVGQQANANNPSSGSSNQAPGGQTDQGSAPSGAHLSRVESAIVDINTTLSGGQAAGTGMILTSNGEVLTNNHVVEGATTISVTVPSTGKTYSATVLGVDPSADVALIKLSGASGLPTVHTASASQLKVGTQVIAIGNALGQGGAPSVTTGSITALDQSITATNDNGTSEQLTGLIESDAPISPGDSGGALVDSNGDVLGMITAGQTRGFRTSTSTLGYAVPATTAMNVIKEIRAGHESADIIIGPSGYIGVQVRDLDPQTAGQLGLNGVSGVLVVGVQPGSPAEQAGIGSNSVITAVNGVATPDTTALGNQIHTHKPGQQISVTWTSSDGASHTATITLTSGPAV